MEQTAQRGSLGFENVKHLSIGVVLKVCQHTEVLLSFSFLKTIALVKYSYWELRLLAALVVQDTTQDLEFSQQKKASRESK